MISVVGIGLKVPKRSVLPRSVEVWAKAVALFALLVGSIVSSQAQTAISFNPGASAELRTDGPFNLGTMIEVGSKPVVVTALGAQDGGNWTAGTIQVGLWDSEGSTLIAYAFVSNSSPAEAGGYRYSPITPVTLPSAPRVRPLTGVCWNTWTPARSAPCAYAHTTRSCRAVAPSWW